MPRDGAIDRPHVTALLAQAVAGRLTLLVAGAGYGKTSVLREWSETTPVAWHTVTSADAISGIFARHIVEALRLRVPEISADIVVDASRLRGHDVDATNRAETAAAALADALDRVLHRRTVLVLDDLQEITGVTEATHLVAALARQAPRLLHLVLASRDASPFRTARLLAHGEATLIGPTELAFSRAEVDHLVADRLGHPDAEAGAAVYQATGGWPVAARLAVETIRTASDPAEVVRTLREPRGLVVTYMADEVIAREQPEVVRFLKSIEPLRGVNVELAEAIGFDDAGEILASVLRRGFYVESSPHRPGWIAVTPLCQAVLRGRHRLDDDARAEIVRTAAAWHEARGEHADALAYRMAIGDEEACVRILAAHGGALIGSGRAGDVVDALAIVPWTRRTDQLEELAGDAWMLLGDWDTALACYGRAAPDHGPVPARLAWRTGLIYYMRGELDAAAKEFDSGDADDPDLADRALLTGWSASVQWLRGDLEGARESAARALTQARASYDHRALANAHTVGAMVAALDGDREANDAHYLAALDHASTARDVFQLVRIHTNRSSHHLEEGDADSAIAEADVALRLADLAGFAMFRALALTNRGEGLMALGRLDEARDDLETARVLFERLGSTMAAYPQSDLGDLHRLRGDAVAARRAYERAIALAEQVGDTQGLVPALAGLAKLHMADDLASAVAYAERACAAGPSLARVKALNAAATALQASGEVDEAIARADHALREAQAQRDRAGIAEASYLLASLRRDQQLADSAVQRFIELRDPIGLVLARLVQAELSPTAENMAVVNEAIEHVRALGAVAVVAAAEARLATWSEAVSSPPVSLLCLGGLRVLRHGEPVPAGEWQSRKARDLLKLLVCRRGRPIAREQVIEMLWPDEEPGRTANRLSVALSTLRAILDPKREHLPDAFLRTDNDTISLVVDNLDIDVERFLDNATRGLSPARTVDPDGARALLETAESLYTGDLFEDDPYPEWMVDLREEARILYLEVARTLADLAGARQDDTARTRYLLRILESDPYNESAHLDLVRLLAAQGRHGEARRRYRLYSRLMDEIDVEAVPYPPRRDPGPH